MNEIHSIGYKHQDMDLIVKFKNGKVLAFNNVTEEEYETIKKRILEGSTKEEVYENFIHNKLPKNR
jgi:hypothetical protein